ncbi:hypothetical protein KAFR_0D02790 [Kazachstania africana CBS 2517]|uniref:DNA repair protein RAD5 n=1 Tax=Kazachstania africana (strain ATCC 22294 / BCRC 22015 / CBS 2517 / CECT 1963 / NBRC 1671 / NRRL Y-8276) TaxID=1071382 RepID=H2AU77_KAZAF|nr:hypothetical protein KAFR_0D02790 [Kazachstania africana CBS 2517]CCF57927.1 hypothetical protein KAFR_0D02790 [Kazachstania africana CBS 2517]
MIETEQNDSEKKRFFKDELESSQETQLIFDKSLENKSSFLFADHSVEDVPKSQAESVIPEGNVTMQVFCTELKSIIPEMSDNICEELYNKFRDSQDRLSNAITYYFEHYNNEKKDMFDQTPSSPAPAASSSSSGTPSSQWLFTQSKRRKTYGERNIERLKPNIRWKRFIGALQVTAMATRPTIRPLKYGTELKLLKTSSSPKIYDTTGRKKSTMANYVRVFDNKESRELGRFSEDIAQTIYPLLDTDEISFEVTMVYCGNKRLSIGDNFILQVDCFLSSLLFDSSKNGYAPDVNHDFHRRSWENSKKGIVETEEELQRRSRTTALISLFDKLSLRPILKEAEDTEKINKSFTNDTEVIDLEDDETLDRIMSQDSEALEATTHNEDSMNLNQLKNFYNITQSSDSLKILPETEPSKDVFKLELRKYQKQGLTWMLRREHEFEKAAGDDKEIDSNMMNPLWRQFMWPKNMSWTAQKLEDHCEDLSEDIFFYANLHTGEFSFEKPILKTMTRGGILSDEMGLGKTISTLALISTVPYDSEAIGKKLFKTETALSDTDETFKRRPYASKTSLVVVPMSLLNQWSDEFQKANASSTMYSEVYYGGNVTNLKKLLTQVKNPPTIVFTTYGIVQNEWSKLLKEHKDKDMSEPTTGLFSLDFYRIVIDEGHIIRNRSAATSKAIMNLSSKCRWVLTGTPIINRLDDLYSLVKFLALEPWSQIGYWKAFVSTPFENKNYKQAFDVVNAILEPVLLRRTKQMKDTNGKPLVELPPKEIRVEKLKLNKSQEGVYKLLLDRAESSVRSGLARGDLLKKYSTILVHILRLRQVCCDVRLIGTQDENDEDLLNSNSFFSQASDNDIMLKDALSESYECNFTQEDLDAAISRLQEKYTKKEQLKSLECSICTTEPIKFEKLIFLECGHPYCEGCLAEYFEYQKQKKLNSKCPNCRLTISSNRLLTVDRNGISDNITFIQYNNNPKSAKIAALLRHLQQLQDSSSGEHVVVFSQFSSYLDILERELSEFLPAKTTKIYKFDGRLSLKERSTILSDFQVKDFAKQKILLLSLKAGGVGLNLTCASHAFMMDPWWSPSMEDQAIDRIHRIGQQNSVNVTRFIIENSIEEKMLRIQERKRTIGEAMDADEDERRKRRIEEIKMLFE